jgi:hypothetical protein
MVMEYESTHETVAHRFLQLTKPSKILRPHRCACLYLDSDDPPATIFDHDIDLVLVLVLGPVVREGDASLLPRCELKEVRHDEGFEQGAEARPILLQRSVLILAQCRE